MQHRQSGEIRRSAHRCWQRPRASTEHLAPDQTASDSIDLSGCLRVALTPPNSCRLLSTFLHTSTRGSEISPFPLIRHLPHRPLHDSFRSHTRAATVHLPPALRLREEISGDGQWRPCIGRQGRDLPQGRLLGKSSTTAFQTVSAFTTRAYYD